MPTPIQTATTLALALPLALAFAFAADRAEAQPGPFYGDAPAPHAHPRAPRIAQAPGKRRPDRADRHANRARVKERLRLIRAWKLTEALALDEQTAARLFPVLARFDERGEAIAAEVARAHAALREEIERPSPRAAMLERRMDELLAAHDRLHAWQRERFEAVRGVLDPEQAAKMLVVLPEIDQEVRRELRRALREGRKRPPRRRGPRAPETVDPFR
jgi:hypothetical protein